MGSSLKMCATIVIMLVLDCITAAYGQQRPAAGFVRAERAPSNIIHVVGQVRWSGLVYLDRDVVVSSNSVLTIMPGTVILIASQLDKSKHGSNKSLVEIKVFGRLDVEGKEDNPIVFFAINEPVARNKKAQSSPKGGKCLDDYLPVNPREPYLLEPSLWGGIQFEPKSRGAIEGCVIANAVDAVFVDDAHPMIKNCVLCDSENGISGGKRAGLKRDPAGQISEEDSTWSAGGNANPTVESCFIFRCNNGASFVNNCLPVFRDTVMTDCRTGIFYLKSSIGSATITGCVFSKVTIAIDSCEASAVIRNNIYHACKQGVMITGPRVPPSFVVEDNTFPLDPYSFSLNDYRAGKATREALQLTFTNNTFEAVTFLAPNYPYPPDGKWQSSSGASHAKKALPEATLYGYKITGTNILFLLDVSGSRGNKRLVKLVEELKKMVDDMKATPVATVSFIWFNKGVVSSKTGINPRLPDAVNNLTEEIDRQYVNGSSSTSSERIWEEGLRVVKCCRIDQINFVSDGKTKTPLSLVLACKANNRRGNLIINTFAIETRQDNLKVIAGTGGGKYSYVQSLDTP